MLDLIKNPIIIALVAGVLTHLYILWSNEGKYKKDMTRKEIKELKKSWSYAPIIVFIITLILSYFYFNQNTFIATLPEPNSFGTIAGNNNDVSGLRLMRELSPESSRSFHLVGKGLNIPHSLPEKMPDVFLETI